MKVLTALAALCCLALPLAGKPTKWKLPDGNTVSAEPMDILGPFAVLGGPGEPGYRVRLGFFSDADALRFAEGLAKQQTVPDNWGKSKSVMSSDLRDAMRLVDGKMVPFDRTGLPEPMLYLVLFGSSGVGESWGFVGGTNWKYGELRKRFGGQVEFILAGMRHKKSEHVKMMTDMNLPFLSLYPEDVSVTSVIKRVANEPPLAVLITRGGAVINVARDTASLEKIYEDIENMLSMSQPNDPRGWKDRLKYFSAIQPKLHPTGAADPLLIGDPFDAKKLKEFGVEYFEAVVQVIANGEVGTVMLKPGARIPENLKAEVFKVFKQAAFVPAVKNGAFVDGYYYYKFGTP